MRHRVMAILAAGMLLGPLDQAACAHAQAASPFREVPLPEPGGAGHGWAYAALVAGASCVGLSYTLQHRADRRYADYLAATDPGRISGLYDETVTLDRAASATLFAGEGLIATGLYLRFLRRGGAPRTALLLAPDRCALAWRF